MVMFIGSYTCIFVSINILSLVTPQVVYYSPGEMITPSKKGEKSSQLLLKREKNSMVIYKTLWLYIL